MAYRFWDDLGLEKVFGGNGNGSSSSSDITWSGDELEWESDGQGLEITIVNSLTDDWDPYFIETLDDWAASPALLLTTMERKGREDSCSHRDGVIRVCNGEYGKGEWKGLNEATYYTAEGTDKKYLISSVAILNDSYLSGKSHAERLNAICHEVGHGYGLIHRDENFLNANLGTCMDYTNSFESNSKPDDIDFQNLANAYGVFGARRNLRKQHEIPIHLRQLDDSVLNSGQNTTDFKRGRIVHKSRYSEVYERDLGDGLKVLTRLLLATNDEHV